MTSASDSPNGRSARTPSWMPAHLVVQAGVVEDVEEVTGRLERHRPVRGGEGGLEVLAGGVEMERQVLGATEPEEDARPAARVGRARRARAAAARVATSTEPASSATCPCSQQVRRHRGVDDPGEAIRCWATVPGSSPVYQRIRAARAWSSPDTTSGSSASTAARSSGCRNSIGSPCANTLATSSRAASCTADGLVQPGQLRCLVERAAVAQDRRRLGQHGGVGPQLSEPPRDGAPQRQGAVLDERPQVGSGGRLERAEAARGGRTRCRGTP